MAVVQKAKDQFTPEMDCEIIRGYVDGREAMFECFEKEHGFSRSAVIRRATALGISQHFIEQLSLSEITYSPRPCLKCDKIFLSRGPGNRLCPKCTKQAG